MGALRGSVAEGDEAKTWRRVHTGVSSGLLMDDLDYLMSRSPHHLVDDGGWRAWG